MEKTRWPPFIVLIAVVIAAMQLGPCIQGHAYYMLVFSKAGILCIVTIGLCLLIGYAGQISLGHAAFFALGGYTTAILTTRFGWPLWATFIAAIAVTVAVAYLIGIPTLRLRGHYLAMATLGIGEIVYHVVHSNIDLTGGSSGIPGVPPLVIFGIDFTAHNEFYYYYLIWGVVIVCLLLAFNLMNSRPGRALMSIHGNEEAANAMGVNTAAFKLKVFVLSAAMAAVAGFLYAHKEKFMGVDSAELMLSVILVAMVAVGGMANLWGAIIATIFLTLLPEFLRAFRELDILIYGAIIVVMMIFMPNGIFVGVADLVKNISGKIAALRAGGGDDDG